MRLDLNHTLGHRLEHLIRLLDAERLSLHLELPFGAGNAWVILVHQRRGYLFQKWLAATLRKILRPAKLVVRLVLDREETIVKRT